MQTPLTICSHSSVAEIPEKDWNVLANPLSVDFDPFISHAFFMALEESGSASMEQGWQPNHITASTPDGHIVGILPLYLKDHSQGEYVFDHGWAQGFELAGGRYYPKLLTAVPFTPVTGRRLFVGERTVPGVRSGLISAALKTLETEQISSFHINFIEPELAPFLEERQFLLRQDTQFQWVDEGYKGFDGFLKSLQSRKRKALRKERRSALEAGLDIQWIEGDAITPDHWDFFYDFYLDTGMRKWGSPYLNREFFEQIGSSLSEHIVLIYAYQDGKPVAGALNLKGSDALYGRYWGALAHFPFLHFEICYYQAIDYALAHGLKRVEAGAQGEHKLLRGYIPTPTYSAHYIAHLGFRGAVQEFLKEEGRHVDFRQAVLQDHLPFRNKE